MSRPAHIAALDLAYQDAMRELATAQERLEALLDLHIRAIDEVDAAFRVRLAYLNDAWHCLDAVETLGYAPLAKTRDLPRHIRADDLERARARAGR